MASSVLRKEDLAVDEISASISRLVTGIKADSIDTLRKISQGLALSDRLDDRESDLSDKQRKIDAQKMSGVQETLDRYKEGYSDGVIEGAKRGFNLGVKKGAEAGQNSILDELGALFKGLPKQAKIILGGIAGLSGLLTLLDIDVTSPVFEQPGPSGEIGKATGVTYDPGQPGLDISFAGNMNRALYSGEVVEIGHQYNPNATGGDGRKGSGYGNYIVIRTENPITGDLMDTLYAHFPDGELDKFSKGDQISRGQLLGRMATEAEFGDPATRPRVGSGTGPHMSIDFLKPDTNEATQEIEAVRKYTDTGVTSGAFDLEPRYDPLYDPSGIEVQEQASKFTKTKVDPVLTAKRAPSISQDMDPPQTILAVQPIESQTVVNSGEGNGGGILPLPITVNDSVFRQISLAKRIA